MTAKLSQNIRSFVASNFINSLQNKNPDVWSAGKSVAVGEIAYYGNAKYVAVKGGTTGTLPPTHTNGVQNDGAVDWVFVESIPINNSFQENLFVFIGKSNEWEDEDNPPNPVTSDAQDYQTLKDIISLKRITSGDIKLACARYDWESGKVYAQYDSTKDPFDPLAYDAPFYVLTDDFNVYKCLNNNGGAPSTSKPSGTSAEVLNLSDGYTWKFMFAVSSRDAGSFMTSDFIPVENKTYDDGSAQWLVQRAAKRGSVSTFEILAQEGEFTAPVVSVFGFGSNANAFATLTPTNKIRQVLVTDAGEGYDGETYALIKEAGAAGSGAVVSVDIDETTGEIKSVDVTDGGEGYTSGAIAIVTGDGGGAKASVTIGQDGRVQKVDVTSKGTGYTRANVWIIPGIVGGVARAVLSPINGHGANAVTELGASSAIISTALNSSNAHFQTGQDSDFRQIGLITDIKDRDGYAYANYYIGPAHPAFSDTSSTLNKITAGSGYILYLSNNHSVTRTAEQEEHIKIAIVF